MEESSDLLVMKAWGVGMNKQGKAEAPEQCGRYQKCRGYLEEKREETLIVNCKLLYDMVKIYIFSSLVQI